MCCFRRDLIKCARVLPPLPRCAPLCGSNPLLPAHFLPFAPSHATITWLEERTPVLISTTITTTTCMMVIPGVRGDSKPGENPPKARWLHRWGQGTVQDPRGPTPIRCFRSPPTATQPIVAWSAVPALQTHPSTHLPQPSASSRKHEGDGADLIHPAVMRPVQCSSSFPLGSCRRFHTFSKRPQSRTRATRTRANLISFPRAVAPAAYFLLLICVGCAGHGDQEGGWGM